MNWFTLLGYEFKKMACRKSFWISLLGIYFLLLLFNSMWIFGNVYVDGERVATSRQLSKVEREEGEKLNGLVLTDEVIRQAIKEEGLTERYTKDNFFDLTRKKLKSSLIAGIFGSLSETGEAEYAGDLEESGELELAKASGTEQGKIGEGQAEEKKPADYYERWREEVLNSFEEKQLTPEEKAYWEESLEKVETPWSYGYNVAYERFLSMHNMNLFLVALGIVICLSPLFSEEYTTKADALLLSSKYGKQAVFWAKIAAGTLFALVWSVVGFGSVLAEEIYIYGAGDLDVPVQILSNFWDSPLSFSAGTMLLILLAGSMLASLMTALLVSVLSARTKSAFGPVIIGLLLTFLPIFLGAIPQALRAPYLLAQLLPARFASADSLFGETLVAIGEWRLPAFCYIPAAYAGIAAVLLILAGDGYLKRRKA